MQILFLSSILLGLGSLLVFFIILLLHDTRNQKVLKKYREKLAVKQYESSLLSLIENQIEVNFDIKKIADVFIDSLNSAIVYNTASYMLYSDKSLIFRSVIADRADMGYLSEVKTKLLASLSELRGESLKEITIEEQITGKLLEDSDIHVAGYFNIPLVLGKEVVGVMNVSSSKVKAYTLDDTGFLYSSINKLLGVVSRMQTMTEEERLSAEKRAKEYERRAYQAEVLRELDERMGYSLDLAKIIEIITGSVGRLLDYHVIAYMVEYQDRILFKCTIKDSVNHAFVSDVKAKMLEAFSTMLDKELKREDVDESVTGAIFNEEEKGSVSSFFNLPLVIGDKVAGVITVASPKQGLYTEEETTILYTITTQASTAVTKLGEVLEREKGKLNSLVATLDDGVVMVDPHWNLLVINTQARKLLDIASEEVGIFDVLDKLSGKIDIRTKIEKAIAKNETIPPSEIALQDKIVQVVILQVKDKDNENLGAVVVFRDVTKEREARNIIEEEVKERTKQVKEEQLKLKASIDSLNMGFLIVDPYAEIVTINPVAKRMLCYAGENQLKGVYANSKIAVTECKMTDIEKDLKSTFDLRAQIGQSIKQMKPIEVKQVAFKNLFLHIFISPIVIAEDKIEVIGAVVLVEDITEAKVMERSKDEFFSIASHELRTPLTAIRGNTSMIKQFYAGILKDAELKSMIDDIHDSSIRLIGIVNDFLDVSRIEQGKIEYKNEFFDIVALTDEVVKELKDIAAEKKVFVKSISDVNSKLPMVFADRNKIKEILLNLAGNSVKFTEKGGVSIQFWVDGDFVKVSVTDTGRGIPLSNQTLLFRKFQQAGSSLFTRDTTKGTGLGLYISKLMIEGMKGAIKLESSAEGKGSVFSFTIPIATAQQIAAQKLNPVVDVQASAQIAPTPVETKVAPTPAVQSIPEKVKAPQPSETKVMAIVPVAPV